MTIGWCRTSTPFGHSTVNSLSFFPQPSVQLPRLSSTSWAGSFLELSQPGRPPRRRRRLLCRSRRYPPCSRPASSQPSHATSVCRLVTRLPPLPLAGQTPLSTPPLRRQRLRSRALILRRSCLHPSSRQLGRRPTFSPPSRATRLSRLASRPRQQPLARRAAPSTPTLLTRSSGTDAGTSSTAGGTRRQRLSVTLERSCRR